MNPKTLARVKQALQLAVFLGKLSQAEFDAVNVLLERAAKQPPGRAPARRIRGTG